MTRSTIPASATVVAASDVLASDLGAEHVLLNLNDGTYYGLEGAGGEIWKMLQTPVTLADICRSLVDQFDVEPERCREDVHNLIGDLVERRLVEVRDP